MFYEGLTVADPGIELRRRAAPPSVKISHKKMVTKASSIVFMFIALLYPQDCWICPLTSRQLNLTATLNSIPIVIMFITPPYPAAGYATG